MSQQSVTKARARKGGRPKGVKNSRPRAPARTFKVTTVQLPKPTGVVASQPLAASLYIAASAARREAALLAARYSPQLMQVIADMAFNERLEPRDRRAAAELVIAYGLGRPPQQVAIDLTNSTGNQADSLEVVNAALATMIARYGVERLAAGFDAPAALDHRPNFQNSPE